DPPVFFELLPTGRDSAFCIAFAATRRVRSFDELRIAVEAELTRGEFVSRSTVSETINVVRGVIPIGNLKRRLPAVVQFGEAALLQPPLLGTAFNEVLEHARSVADQIVDAFERRRVRGFQPTYKLAKRLNDRLQWWFATRAVDASAEQIDYIIRVMAHIPPPELFALYSNELTVAQFPVIAARLAAASVLESRH